MTAYDKLEWIHFAMQEAQNGNLGELDRALELVEVKQGDNLMNNFNDINTESGFEFDAMLHCPWDSLLTDNNDLGDESNDDDMQDGKS